MPTSTIFLPNPSRYKSRGPFLLIISTLLLQLGIPEGFTVRKILGISSFGPLTIFQGIASLASQLGKGSILQINSGNGQPLVMPLVFSFRRKQRANSTFSLHAPFLELSAWLYTISAQFLSPNNHVRF